MLRKILNLCKSTKQTIHHGYYKTRQVRKARQKSHKIEDWSCYSGIQQSSVSMVRNVKRLLWTLKKSCGHMKTQTHLPAKAKSDSRICLT